MLPRNLSHFFKLGFPSVTIKEHFMCIPSDVLWRDDFNMKRSSENEAEVMIS